jgi:hypothetical protein
MTDDAPPKPKPRKGIIHLEVRPGRKGAWVHASRMAGTSLNRWIVGILDREARELGADPDRGLEPESFHDDP